MSITRLAGFMFLAVPLLHGSTPSTLTLNSLASSSTLGESITLTAVVSPSSATGKVTFYDDITVLGSGTLSGGQAVLSTSLLASGKRRLKAQYAGDSTYAPSQSPVLTHVVNVPPQVGFQPPVSYPLAGGAGPYGPVSVAVGDFNRDGKPDLAVTNPNELDIFMGKGDGTFQAGVPYSVPGPQNVVAADFNQDGRTDLAVLSQSQFFEPESIYLLNGNGDGTFQIPASPSGGCCFFAATMVVADFNGDTFPDLAVADPGQVMPEPGGNFYALNGGNVTVFFGGGDGTLQAPVFLDIGGGATAIGVGDFNGDGKADIAVDRQGQVSTQVEPIGTGVLFGKGDGTFQPVMSLTGGGATAGDFNGDGIDDLALVNAGVVRVYPGSLSGSFQNPLDSAPSGGGFAVGDFNGDGIPDLLSGDNSQVSIFLGIGDGTFHPAVGLAPGFVPGFIAVSSLSASGSTDLVSMAISAGTINVLLGITPAAGTSTVLTSSPNPSYVGQSVMLTATVSPSTATGLVVFYDGSTALGTVGLSGGSASLAVPPVTFALGTHSLTASYGEFGSLNNPVFTSPVVSQAVIAPTSPTTTTLTTSANPSVFGRQITLTATVTGAPSGSVTFYDGVNVLGSGTLASGKATLTTILPITGVRSLTARYDGAGSEAPSVSAAFVETVNALPVTSLHSPVTYPAGNSNAVVVDVNGDGKPDIVTAGVGSDLVVMLGNSDGSFQSPLHIAGSANVVTVTAGDLNGDGHIDLIALNDDTNYYGLQVTADVFLGRGDGTFGTPVSYPVSLNNFEDFGHMMIADLNVDGRADLVIAESSLLVLLGNGDGTFQPPITGSLSDPFISVTADFNGDGKPDLATLSDGGLGVQMGNGDGTFQPVVYLNGGGSGLMTADFNGDGKADLASPGAGEGVEILLGNGDGTFQSPIQVPVASGGNGVAAGDFNGDGKADLAVVGPSVVTLLTGNGDGTFETGGSYAASFSSWNTWVQVADFNADGLPDIAAGSSGGAGPVNILFGVAAGTKTPTSTTLTSSQNPSAGGAIVTLVAKVSPATLGTVAFFDGSSEIGTVALSNNAASLSIALAVGTHPLTASYSGDLGFAPSTSPILSQVVVNGSAATPTTATLTSSLNPAGLGERVTLTATVMPGAAMGKVTFYDGSTVLGTSVLSGGTAAFTTTLLETGAHSLKAIYEGDVVNYALSETSILKETVTSLVPTGFQSAIPLVAGGEVYSADFNGDGTPDLAYLINTTIEIFVGKGNGTFASPQNYALGFCAVGPSNLAVADFNGDGNADIVTNCGQVLLGRGDGTFSMGLSFPVTQYAEFIAVADFNQDGKPDVVTSDYIASQVYVSMGNGDGTFQGAIGFDVGAYPGMMAAGDFNGDGLPDLAVATGTNVISVLLNNGKGFAQPINYSTAFAPAGITAADLNADGKLDLVFTAYDTTDQTESLTTLLGNGDGTFHHPSLYGYPYLSGFATGDLNGDGKPDIAVGNPYYHQSIFYGNGDGTLQTPVNLSGVDNGNLIIVDLNRDGRNDIVGSEVILAEPAASSFPGVVISSSQNPAASIDSITLTAQVSPTDVTGNVTFYDGSVNLGVSALSQGTTSLTVKSFSVGSHSLTAVYGGGGGVSSATSAVLTETILAELSPGPVTVDPLAANVLINPSGEEGLTGWSPSSSESTVVSQGAPGFGSYSFDGKQVRDAFITQTVNLGQLTTGIAGQLGYPNLVANYSFWFADTNPGSGSYGSITLTFLDGNGHFIGQGTSQILQNTGGTSWVNATGSFPVPPNTLTINYTMNFLTSGTMNTGLIDGNVLNVVVPTTTTLGSSQNPATPGSTITLSATVYPVASGTVTLYDGSVALGSDSVRYDGTAAFSLPNLAPGKHLLTAVYQGGPADYASTSNLVTEVILTEMAPGAPVPNPLTANLLVNPGGEEGATGWYENPFYGGSTLVIPFSPPPSTGSSSFWSDNYPTEFITQTVNLTENSGFTFAQVDSGKLAANYSFWFLDYYPQSGEHGEITLTFLDANKVPLAQGISAALRNTGGNPTWVNGAGSFPIPAGTRIIHYTMDFLGVPPAPTTGYMDDNVLTVSQTP